jgi:hypothetical protein
MNLRLQDDGDDVADDEYPSVPFWSKAGEFGAEENDTVVVTQLQDCVLVVNNHLQVFESEVDASGDERRRDCQTHDIDSQTGDSSALTHQVCVSDCQRRTLPY